MKTLIIIPARYRSSRFPGKPLADILGKPMIQHVYEKANRSKKADKVMVATDDLRIYSVVKEFGGKVVMTSPDHKSGTDRITEVVEKEKGDIYINLQGDQPLICPEDIDLLIDKMAGAPDCNIATLCHPISQQEAKNPNAVKVVLSSEGRALYFSRSLIPYAGQGTKNVSYNKHIGIYGFRRHVLVQYKNLPFSQLESQEKLEQLRLLEAGFSIDVLETNRVNDQGVDTPEDLEIVKKILLHDQLAIAKEIESVFHNPIPN
jgi:3-deoxy-D-manno-octulosonate 8-phosphate phosphatase (KDO 8-P phosphatase)